MLINNLEVGSIISIEVTSTENKVARLESRIVDIRDASFYEKVEKIASKFNFKSYTFIEPCVKDNQIINFLSDKCRCAVTALYKDKPYRWEPVKIVNLKNDFDETIHVIFSNVDVDTFNRREEYRVWLGYDALVKIRDSKVPHVIILKDISWHGCGIIIDEKYDCSISDTVELQFFEQVYNTIKKDYDAELYKMTCYVVRKIALDDGKILLGCKSDNPNDVINKLIFRKQSERNRTGNYNKYTVEELAKKLGDL